MRRGTDDGFALIGVVWLMLLGSAVVALLMLRARHEAESARSDAQALVERAAASSAAETVAAELLLLGPRSQWATTPSEGSLEVDGSEVTIEVTSEEGRVDLNAVSLDRLEAIVQDLGIAATTRKQILAQVERRRQGTTAFSGLSEIEALFAGTGGERCLADAFTFASGLAEPRQDQAPELLKIGGSSEPQFQTPQKLGTPLRIVVRLPSGRTLTTVLRVTPSPTQPLLISDWIWHRVC